MISPTNCIHIRIRPVKSVGDTKTTRHCKPCTSCRSISCYREVRGPANERRDGTKYVLGIAIVGETIRASYQSSVSPRRNKCEAEPSPYPEYQAQSSLSSIQSILYRKLIHIQWRSSPGDIDSAHAEELFIRSGHFMLGSRFLTHHVCSLPLIRGRRMRIRSYRDPFFVGPSVHGQERLFQTQVVLYM